ncbi:MAG: tRNA (N(6)-L-threonylcarbamoyladenosine(37)-C(2))-methylthiotransferase MtaB [Syntrophomonadaceae bacterium]
MIKVALATLGCKVNQVESEAIKEDLLNQGYELVDFSQEAEVYIINTCTVTHVSDRKSRALIRRARRRNPRARIIAVGCLAQVDGEKLASLADVDLVLGNKEQVAEWVDRMLQLDNSQTTWPKFTPGRPEAYLSPVFYTLRHERSRAFIKIEDGCEAHCSYCIVPQARGPVRSKKAEDIKQEIIQLTGLGYREIVLTGIHIGAYGRDLPPMDLTRLLEYLLDETPDDYRLRLGSIEPLEISRMFIDILKGSRRICRHLHIPLQSGSDRILEGMNRGYRRDYFKNLVEELAAEIPGIAITTDVMVGFPGEEQVDFGETYSLVKDLPLRDMHVFKYSPRPGTPAACMPGKVSENDKQERSGLLLQLARDKERAFIKSQEGRVVEVLVERALGNDRYRGLTDNYLNVEFADFRSEVGELVQVELKAGGRGRKCQ